MVAHIHRLDDGGLLGPRLVLEKSSACPGGERAEQARQSLAGEEAHKAAAVAALAQVSREEVVRTAKAA